MIVVNGRFLTERATGVQRFASELIEELAQLRGDVVLAVPPDASGAEVAGVTVRSFGSCPPVVWEQIELPLWLRRHGSPLLINLANRAPLAYSNQISTLHDLMPWRYPGSFSRRFRLQFKLVAGLGVVRRSARVLTVSETSKADLVDHYGLDQERVRVIYNAADGEWATAPCDLPGTGEGQRPYVLAFGRSGANRNLGLLLDGFAQSCERMNFDLVLVGEADTAVLDAASGSGRIRLAGRVSDRRLTDLYRGAHCFIAPSLYEGFDIPALEAQRAGSLVLASDIPVHREVLGNGALFFDAKRPESLAALLGRLEQHESRTAVLMAARSNQERFSWKKSAMGLNGVIEEVLA